jgi:nitrogen regulatory protein PII
MVITVVGNSEVEKIFTTITDIDFTDKSWDGIIIVTNVESVQNIASKKTDSKSL